MKNNYIQIQCLQIRSIGVEKIANHVNLHFVLLTAMRVHCLAVYPLTAPRGGRSSQPGRSGAKGRSPNLFGYPRQ